MTGLGLQSASDHPPQIRSGSARAPQLRPYQLGAISAVRHELERHRSTLVIAATGTGKTVTFAELARLWAGSGERTLVLVHRDELIKQAKRKCEALGLWPDVEKGRQRANTLAKVVLASVQSMRGARLTRWARTHFRKIIVDEAHHAAAKGYRAIIDHFVDAQVVGFTATPDRADGLALGEVFETVAFRFEIRAAIAEGYLVPITARRVVVESVDLDDVTMRGGDFAQDQLAEVMAAETALRGQAVPLLEIARDRPTIAFCVDVEHSRRLAQVLNSMRPGCARYVSGATPEDEREALLEGFARGDYQFLTNCDVLTEGFDAPVCSCVAMCRPTKSRARYVQGAGRGLRLLGATYAESVSNGKVDCLLINFTDANSRLVGPADCLAGKDELDDDLREAIDRAITGRQLDITSVIAHAADEVEKLRADRKVNALVKYFTEHVDPFIGEPADEVVLPCNPLWEGQPPSKGQLDVLASDDYGVTVAKLPKEFSRADAWRLLCRLKARSAGPLCSYKAARKLTQAGVVNAKDITHVRARELLDKLREGGWRPSAIAYEPEVRAGREAFVGEEGAA